jgi:hypothetical protein
LISEWCWKKFKTSLSTSGFVRIKEKMSRILSSCF